jgi:hypothetical protein
MGGVHPRFRHSPFFVRQREDGKRIDRQEVRELGLHHRLRHVCPCGHPCHASPHFSLRGLSQNPVLASTGLGQHLQLP